MLPSVLAPKIDEFYQEEIRRIDKDLTIIFNCGTERFEVYRNYGYNNCQWILRWENNDGSFRRLDSRLINKLWQMDVIARWGSIINYERHLDEKLNKWKEDKNKEDNHELLSDLKEERFLWQRAAENFRSGIVNDPPEQRDRKIISYPKGA